MRNFLLLFQPSLETIAKKAASYASTKFENKNAIIFYDTAGITKTKDKIEREGIRRTKKLLKEADIILPTLSSKIKNI